MQAKNYWMRLWKNLPKCFCSIARMYLFFLPHPLVCIWNGTWYLDIQELSCHHRKKIHTLDRKKSQCSQLPLAAYPPWSSVEFLLYGEENPCFVKLWTGVSVTCSQRQSWLLLWDIPGGLVCSSSLLIIVVLRKLFSHSALYVILFSRFRFCLVICE